MSREQGNNPPTENDMNEFLKIIQKDMVDITERQRATVLEIVSKAVNYDNYSLSATSKKSIYQHYAYSQYGISKVSLTSDKPLQLDKGEVAEPDAIKLLSSIDGVEYVKNTTLYSNRFFKGIPDIVLFNGDKIVGVKDVKVPLDFISFLERVDGDLLKDDAWEMRGYLDILDLKEGEVCYCLVDMPDQYKDKRLAEHQDRMLLQGFTKEHIRRRIRQISKSMMYDYIPDEFRIRKFPVHRKPYFTAQAHRKVKVLRAKLAQLHDKFTNAVPLLETELT